MTDTSELITDFVRRNRVCLRTTDPAAPLDDLDPLLEIIGGARVVAVGENNHHVREFGLLRHRIARLLVEKAGFTVVAVEPGFTEARAVDAWVRGGPGAVGDVASEGIGFTLGDSAEVHDMLRWLRSRHDAGHPITFSGLDVPGSAGTPTAALNAVADYLDDLAPDVLALVRAAQDATQPYAGPSSAVAMTRYAELDVAARDAATAAVSRLLAHVESLRPLCIERGGRAAYDEALHHLRGVWRLDQYLRELDAMTRGSSLTGVTSSRDVHMANTVRWLRDQNGPDTRIVLLVHNGHLQRVPFTPTGATAVLPLGQQLATDLGDDYVAVGLTCSQGTTPVLTVDPDAPLGFTVHTGALPPTEPDSVEALLGGTGLSLLDLRTAPAATGPHLIRHADTHVPAPVFDAFDALVHVPTVSTTSFVAG